MTFSPNVLIVDDDPNAHFFAKRVLGKAAGVTQFHQAYNGHQAIRILEEEHVTGNAPITHIMLDVEMPGLDGPGFLKAFDKLPADRRQDIRIVVVTASSQLQRNRLDGVKRYVADVIDKVIRTEDCPRVLGRQWMGA